VLTDWGPHLAIGVQEIDAQHREIVRPLAALDAALARGDTGAAALTVQVVSRYVVYHFRTEERWMRRNRYPGLREHVARHDELVADLVSLTYDLADAPGSSAMRLRVRSAVAWLQEHIRVEDQRLGQHAATLPVVLPVLAPALTPAPGALTTLAALTPRATLRGTTAR
jgi:hemerythrin